jgi:hypothetical protein
MTRSQLKIAIDSRRDELVSTLTTLASALSVTADLPTQAELNNVKDGFDDYALLVDLKIETTLVRVLNALKIREDAN